MSPPCAHDTVGSYASLSVRPKLLDNNSYLKGQGIEMDESKVDLEGQGHMSKVKVTMSFRISRTKVSWVYVKGYVSQDRPKATDPCPSCSQYVN